MVECVHGKHEVPSSILGRGFRKMENKEITVVYMVAGMSSRFGGKIKQFARVGPKGETLIECSLKQAIAAGIGKVIFIVGEKTEAGFKEMFGDNYGGIEVKYAYQYFNPAERDKPCGTTDALCCALGILDSPFVVCNGDDIYGENTFRILVEHLKNKKGSATIGYKLGEVLSEVGSVNRGMYVVESGKVKSITETFDITRDNLKSKGLSEEDLCSQNIFALYPETVLQLNNVLIKFKEEHKGDRKIECLLPKELNDLIVKGKLELTLYPTPDKWIGVTNPADEEAVRKALAFN